MKNPDSFEKNGTFLLLTARNLRTLSSWKR